MGNDISAYKNCTLIEKHDISHAPFAVYTGYAPDNTDVTVFVYQEDEVGGDIIENSIKYMKTLKHPGIVKLLGIDRSHDETWVITENVIPLESVIEKMSPYEICAGLYDVIQVMDFIHEKAYLCHNNLNVGAIFVAEGGAWKVGSLDFVQPFQTVTSSKLSQMSKWRAPKCKAPEEKSNYKGTAQNVFARDSYAFGHFAEQMLELIGDLEHVKSFERRIQDLCLNADPRQRLKFIDLFDDQLFQSDFVQILNFLRSLTVHESAQKEVFFQNLVSRLYTLPANLVASRLSRPLLARFVLLEPSAVERLLPHLLTPCSGEKRPQTYIEGEVNPLLPPSLFQKYMIPEIIKIFHVRDAHIRVVLLRHFHAYHYLFDKEILKAVILPQILVGLRDVHDEVGEWSLRALADLVPVLGGNAVISPKRYKFFTSGTPKKPLEYTESPPTRNIKSPRNANAPISNGINLEETPPPKPAAAKPARTTLKDVAKEAERERRREEARRRAEERRLKREQRQKNPIKAKFIEEETEEINTLESDDGGPADLNKSKSDPPPSNLIGRKNSQSDETSEISNESNESEDKAEEQSFERTESDIDLEIEAELNAMESTLPKETQSKIVETVVNEPEIHVDWSDAVPMKSSQNKLSMKDINKGGVLKLKSSAKTKSALAEEEKVPTSPLENNNSAENTSFDEWSGGWDSIEATLSPAEDYIPINNNIPSSPTSPSIKPLNVANEHDRNDATSGKKSKPAAETQVTRKPPKIQDNWDTFDIKSMDSKNFKVSGSSEMDFFADMTPSLDKPKAANVLDVLSGSSTKKDKEDSKPSEKLSFAVQDTTNDEDTGGWENDDFDW